MFVRQRINRSALAVSAATKPRIRRIDRTADRYGRTITARTDRRAATETPVILTVSFPCFPLLSDANNEPPTQSPSFPAYEPRAREPRVVDSGTDGDRRTRARSGARPRSRPGTRGTNAVPDHATPTIPDDVPMTDDARGEDDDATDDEQQDGRRSRFKQLSDRVRRSGSGSEDETAEAGRESGSETGEADRGPDDGRAADSAPDEDRRHDTPDGDGLDVDGPATAEDDPATSERAESATEDLDSWDWIDDGTEAADPPPDATGVPASESAVSAASGGSASPDPRGDPLETDPTEDDPTDGDATSVGEVGSDGPAADPQSDDGGRWKRLWSGSGRRGAADVEDPTPTRDPDSADAVTEEFAGDDEYIRPDGLDPDPGTSVLIQCGSQDDRKHAACTDLLGLADAGRDRNVLLVRYRKLHGERLERIAEAADRMKLISIGYSQPVPDSVRSAVETVQINNPNDITRLGILVSGTVDDWSDEDEETLVCFDSLNVLLEYKDVRSAFRFLHIFLGTLDSADAISHFHVDPLAGDSQNINTLKPLFDEVVSIDDVGVHRE